MCLIFIVIGQCPEYPLIIAANRDEYHARPSLAAHFWPHTRLLAGKDLLAGGTWLGVTRQGDFAAVTNYRHPAQEISLKSRGHLVTDFLESQASPEEYSTLLEKSRHEYASYNCLFGSLAAHQRKLHYFSNQTKNTETLKEGIHGLSNALLNTPWPKVNKGKNRIQSLLQKTFNTEDWMDLLTDTHYAADSSLPDTGIGIEKERLLSPVFIRGGDYGTRCSTLITVSKNGTLRFDERTYSPLMENPQTRTFSFEIMP